MSSTKRIRILYSETYTHVAGGQKGLLDLVHFLDKDLFEPVVQIQGPGKLLDGLKERNIRVITRRLEPFKNRWLPFSWQLGVKPFSKVIDEIEPDIIHSNHLYVGRYSGRAAKNKKIPCLVTLRLVQPPEIYDNHNRINTLKVHDAVIANSDEGRKIFEYIPELKGKLKTIKNGMDLTKFYPRKNKKELKEKYGKKFGFPADGLIIMQISSRVPQKGNEILTKSFLELAHKYPNIYLVFVGGAFAKADNANTLKEMAKKQGIESRLILTDFVWDVSEFLNIADISVLASKDREGLPRSLIEAMASGNPLIGTDVGGVKELVINDVNGFLIPPDDSEILKSKLEILIKDQDLRKKFGAKGTEKAEKEFNIKNMIEKYQREYLKLLKN